MTELGGFCWNPRSRQRMRQEGELIKPWQNAGISTGVHKSISMQGCVHEHDNQHLSVFLEKNIVMALHAILQLLQVVPPPACSYFSRFTKWQLTHSLIRLFFDIQFCVCDIFYHTYDWSKHGQRGTKKIMIAATHVSRKVSAT